MCVCVLVSEVVSPDLAAPVAPPVVISPISSTSASEGEPARFHCRVHGDGRSGEAVLTLEQTGKMLPVKWFFNGAQSTSCLLTRCENQLVPQGEGNQAVRILQDVSV